MGKYFKDIKGQDNAVRILSAQLKTGDLSHAYIFLGAEGSGKEYLAREFAKYILCEKREGDSCPNCVRFDNGSNPDFIYISGRNGIKIDAVREAVERINLSPNMSKYKVLLFTKAENLGIEAANALLKTFEEPPSDSIIILTAVSEKSLPQTIVSRGQKIKFFNLNKNDIREMLLLNDFSAKEIDKVLTFAEGDIGRAKDMLGNPIKFKELEEMHQNIEKLVKGDSIVEHFKIIDAYEKDKKLNHFFDVFAREVYKAIAEKVKDTGVNDASNPFISLSVDNLASLGHKTLKIYEDLEYNINLKLAMEEMILDNLRVRNAGAQK